MVKYLTKHGNSFALVIDRPILDLLKIRPADPLEVTTDGQRIVVGIAPNCRGKRSARRAVKKRM